MDVWAKRFDPLNITIADPDAERIRKDLQNPAKLVRASQAISSTSSYSPSEHAKTVATSGATLVTGFRDSPVV